jgi:hypothetical protein
MSWIEKIKTDLIITTGDAKEYRPQWLNATKSVDFNITEFDFVNVQGSLVDRREPKARKFNLELYFQGEDCLDTSSAFELSANDKRAWRVSHPFYGSIICHPASLLFDNTKLNVTKITGTIIETITNDKPKSNISPVDKITEDKQALDEVCAEVFAATVTPEASDVSSMIDSTQQTYDEGALVARGDDAQNYFNLFNTANAAILNATAQPLAAIRALQAVINAPAIFADNVQNRFGLLQDQFDALRNQLTNIFSPNEKRIYQAQGSAMVSSMALAAATPQTASEYGNMQTALDIAETLLNNYNQFLEDLDGLQTDNGGLPESYIPDPEPLIGLNDLISFTVSNLFDIALEAKQERAIILEEDSNAILLTHRFYGLDAADELLDYFIATNQIGLNELLQIRKGRRIFYYV